MFRCNYIKVWEYVKFSLPLLPNSISLWLSRTFDRILISYYCGTAIAGVYSTAVQVSFVLYFIQDSVTQAFGPMQIRLFIQNKVEAVRCLKIMSKIFYIIMLVSVVFLSSFCKEIMNFVLDEKFVPPVIVVALLSSVYIYQAQYRLFSDILIYHKKINILCMRV
ncbi:lipopolysaccharide biosynthesis protein [Bacteroides fragilis]